MSIFSIKEKEHTKQASDQISSLEGVRRLCSEKGISRDVAEIILGSQEPPVNINYTRNDAMVSIL